LIAAICGVVVVQVIYGFLVIVLVGPQMDVRGQFGDLFGGVTALFTGFAFAGVIYTILLQSNELELQREELRLNRHALERSANAQSDQVERLEEAAELTAVSTLLSNYGTLLQPMRNATQNIRQDLAEHGGGLPNVDLSQADEIDYYRIKRHQERLEEAERPWSHIIQKEQDLVRRLETLVDQRSQGNGAAQEPE
jgi:hypothetical protein